MKQVFIIILMILFNFSIYAYSDYYGYQQGQNKNPYVLCATMADPIIEQRENQSENTTNQSRTQEKKAEEKNMAESKDKIFIGFNFGIGISTPLSLVLDDSSVKIKPGFHGGFESIFYITKNLGFIFDANVYYYHVKEQNDADKIIEYRLFYAGIVIAPVMRFGGFNFYAGVYYGFILYAQFNNENIEETGTEAYTMPDIGYVFGAGYMINLGKNMKLFLNLQTRGQLNNFIAYNDPVKTGSKVFAFYLNASLLFGVK